MLFDRQKVTVVAGNQLSAVARLEVCEWNVCHGLVLRKRIEGVPTYRIWMGRITAMSLDTNVLTGLAVGTIGRVDPLL